MERKLQYSFDRRSIDSNGHMHVPNCRVTKGSVDKYLGMETGGATLRGFRAMDMISIYRDETELVKALQSFDAVPLMLQHVVTTAEDPQQELLVGCATNPRWEDGWVVMDLTVWDQAGIDVIQSNEQSELSAGYARDLDWTPGKSPEGLQYDARMFNIKCNHVALVRKGRVDGAVVADKAPEVHMFDKLKFPKIVSALFTALGATPKAESALALDAALESELAVDGKKGTAETQEPVVAELTGDEKAAKEKADKEASEKAEKEESDRKTAEACAMDAKINEAVATAVAAAEARVHGLYTAKSAVADKVGDVSLDSAELVYRFALTKVGVNHEAVTADALPALWESSQKTANVSLDTARREPFDITALFPGIASVRKG
jgi:hypothetical protein